MLEYLYTPAVSMAAAAGQQAGHPLIAMGEAAYSKRSRKAFRLSVEAILVSVMYGTKTRDTAGDVVGSRMFLNACWLSPAPMQGLQSAATVC